MKPGHGMVGWLWPILALVMPLGAEVMLASDSQIVSSLHAYAIHRKINLDGDLSDWDGIPGYANFLTNTRHPEPGKKPTYFMAAWDEDFLYLAAIAEGQEKITAKNPPGTKIWWTDDAIEPYFWPPQCNVPAHFAFNPVGTKFKEYLASDDFQVMTQPITGGYLAEARFPLNGSPLPKVKPGDEWQFRLGRENQADQEYTIWPLGGDFSLARYFGKLIFVETAAVAKAVPLHGGPASPAGASAQAPISPQGLKTIKNYTVYYGKDTAEIVKLAAFDLAIVDPRTLSTDQLKELQAKGVIVIAYISLGEIAPDWYLNARVDPSWILGTNETWHSDFIDASQEGWHDLILNQAVPDILLKGFDGLFFDTVDTVGLYPRTMPGMAALIGKIRGQCRDKVLVMNRGFAVLDQAAPRQRS